MMYDTLNNESEYRQLIRPLMIVGRITAIWPLERDSRNGTGNILRFFHIVFILFLVIGMSIAVTLDVIKNRDDLNEATECALICTAFYLCVVRMIVYTLHREDVSYVVETMRNDWTQSSYQDIITLREMSQSTFQLAKIFISTVAITIVFFMSVPIIEIFLLNNYSRVLPFRGYFCANQTVSPIFELLFIYNMSAGGIAGSTIASATSFNLILVTHGSVKFVLLQRKLENIKSDDPNVVAIVRDCVRQHQDAITFAEALERIINVLALGQFLISTGLLCFAGFQMTSMIEDKGRLMKYSAFLNSAILELFLFSVSGNRLIDESTSVGISAYKSDWVGTKVTQDLQIMMMRSLVPCKITAAKFYCMSLEKFTAVLSTSFSYFTVLKTMNDD